VLFINNLLVIVFIAFTIKIIIIITIIIIVTIVIIIIIIIIVTIIIIIVTVIKYFAVLKWFNYLAFVKETKDSITITKFKILNNFVKEKFSFEFGLVITIKKTKKTMIERTEIGY
jgi:hypothetical protein